MRIRWYVHRASEVETRKGFSTRTHSYRIGANNSSAGRRNLTNDAAFSSNARAADLFYFCFSNVILLTKARSLVRSFVGIARPTFISNLPVLSRFTSTYRVCDELRVQYSRTCSTYYITATTYTTYTILDVPTQYTCTHVHVYTYTHIPSQTPFRSRRFFFHSLLFFWLFFFYR